MYIILYSLSMIIFFIKELNILDSSDAIQFLALIILICLSAFFSSAETSMTTVNKIRIQSLAEQGDKRAPFS